MATLEELREAYTDARASITTLDAELGTEWKEIEKRVFREQRPKTPEERARQEEIEDLEDDLMERLRDLAFRNLKDINEADDLDRLNDQIATIKHNLDGTLEGLRDLERYAATTTKVVSAIEKVVQKAADVVL